MIESADLRQRVAAVAAADAELLQLAERLQASETRYRRLFETAKDGILILDAETGEIAAVNPFLTGLLGYSAQELIGKHLWEIGPFHDVVASQSAFQELQDKSYIRYEDLPLQTRDGRSIAVEFVSNVYLADDRSVIQCNIRDITERKRLEDMLRKSQAQLQLLANNVLDLVSQIRLDGTFVYVSPSHETVLGYTPVALVGTSAFALVHPEDVHSVRAVFTDAVDRRTTGRAEFRYRHADGRYVWLEVVGKVILADPGGAASGVVLSARDISERKTASLQRERLVDIVEASPDFIGFADPITTHIQYMNRGGRRMCGIGEDEDLAPLTIRDLHPAWMNTRLVEEVIPMAVRDGLWRGEGALVHRNGREIPVSMVFLARKNASGETDIFYTVSRDITEAKRAERTLRLQGAALSAAANAMVITDRAGLIEWVNPAFSDLTGYAVTEVIGKNSRDLVKSGQHDPAFYKTLWDTIMSGHTWRGEITNRRKDGRLYPEDMTITPVRDTQGAISHFIAVKQDITERKRVEEDLRARAALSALGADIGLALTTSDSLGHALQRCVEGLVTHLGAAFARIWTLNEGLGVLELQASAGLYTHVNGLHGRVPLGHSEIGRLAQSGQSYQTNTVIGDPQVHDQAWARREGMVAFAGHPLRVNDRVVGALALFARQALPAAVMATLASVADHIALGVERHRNAEAFRLTEERLRFALESANVGVWDLDYTTGATRWSEALEAQYGLKPGTFGGTFEAFVEHVHPDDRASVMETERAAAKSGDDFRMESRAIWADGTVRWLTTLGRVRLGEGGEPVRGIGISLDVTEQHTLAAQFQQAQKMEAIGQLAGGVAHDFNNLLTIMLGHCEMLLADADPNDPRSTDIAAIQQAGMTAAYLTRQLLAFSRKQIIEPTRLDLNAVVTGMRAMIARLIGEDVKVELVLGAQGGFVRADRTQIEQIILNLAVNGRDAMPTGGTLTIETADVDLNDDYEQMYWAIKAGPYVVLRVTDTGTGMTPEVQTHLFQPFFTTKNPGKGTGLGLATVYGIVRQSGGSVTVYSEIGHGSSFKVYLPRLDHAEDVIAVRPPAASQRGRGERVLVVEDMAGLRALTERMLVRLGYTVLSAADAAEALQVCNANPSIGLVLTDVVMPGVTGPELATQLKAGRPTLKVIYMSGYTQDSMVQRGVLEHEIAFLRKPFSSETLGRKLREVLDG